MPHALLNRWKRTGWSALQTMWANAKCCTVLPLSAAALIFNMIVIDPAQAVPVKTALPWGGKEAEKPTATAIETLARVEKYLNDQRTITADFKQESPDGSSAQGKMYLERPGKMRWQYEPPMPVLMVANGQNFIYYDSELDQLSYLPIDESLAAFITRKNVSFEDPAVRVINFREGSGSIRFTILQAKRPEDGRMTLEFSDNPLKLTGMELVDSTEQVTKISLSNLSYNTSLEPKLFVFEDPKKDGRVRHYKK